MFWNDHCRLWDLDQNENQTEMDYAFDDADSNFLEDVGSDPDSIVSRLDGLEEAPDEFIEMPQFNTPDVVIEQFGSIESFRTHMEKFILRHKVIFGEISKHILFLRRKAEAGADGGRTPLHKLLEGLQKRTEMDKEGVFFLCKLEDKIKLARTIKEYKLPFSDRYLNNSYVYF
jgi:hypothetical protein